MALFSRASDATGPAVAEYARILDGAHLWLAVRGQGPLSLRSPDGVDVEVPTEERDGLLTAVLALDDVPDGSVLMAGLGRRAAAVRHGAAQGDGAVTHDGRAGAVLDASDGRVVVRRQAVRGIEASGFASTDAGVELRLALDGSSGAVAAVALVVKDQVVAELPAAGGRLALGDLSALAPGTTATFRVGGQPVVRRGNVLARPNHAVLLPPMLEPDVELRWLKDGRLAVHRTDGSTQ